MFEIPKDQLRRLNDVELRELVARLCEAELNHTGAPVSAVRWGGTQTTADGGLDIDVQVEDSEFQGNFVPRARTGIQVKKSKMPPGKVVKEMSPKGVLRPIFSELARHNGCYVIVSLDDDLAPGGRPLADRNKAMQAQIEAVKNLGDLRTKFYEGGDLANWLRQHPGVQLWVRKKLGLPCSGWRPFERWSTTPPNAEDDLICKEGVTISLPGKVDSSLPGKVDRSGIAQGIEKIRELVRSSGKAVRIVGLSGVGKSRIVQALFEESVGNQPLHRHLAIYADLGETPNPSATEVVERLDAARQPAILVLDNCPSDTHSRIANQVASSSDIQLVTIEFDIREDKPETTSVVRIDAEGPDTAETLIKRRYPDLGQVNARRVAEFSGGNARLALALADAVSEAKESLSSFSNAQLFDRLFYQRGVPDPDFLKSAEVLALVYSFSIGENENDVDELATLAGLLDQNRLALHRAAQTLVDRQLAQRRGDWRAVLPHAVANQLAERALRNIPVHDILNTFQGLPNPRLLKSFGKRLGYLHGHEIAQDIVKSWLSPGGLLHDMGRLNGHGIQLLRNVAPVAPEDVLSVIESQDETFFSRENPHFSAFVDLLVKIAYDADLFERCVYLLAKFALTEREGENWDSIRDRLFGLFALYFSGTEAGPDARENLVRRFLSSDEPDGHQLGLGMLKAALQGRNVLSSATLEFGARPRSYSYPPGTLESQDQWFTRFIRLAQEVATDSNVHLSCPVRRLLADALRELWHHPGLRVALADFARVLNDQRPWLEGWRAVREIKHYDYRRTDGEVMPDGAELLDELDEMLKPKRLADEVRTYVLSEGHQLLTLDEGFDFDSDQKWKEASKRMAARVYDLGTIVAGEPQVMDALSQDLFTAGHGYLVEFGRGMASACRDLRALWNQMVEGLELAGDQAWHCGVLLGVLRVIHQHDKPLAQEILDESVQNRLLRKFIVNLQRWIPSGHKGVDRLRRSLDFDDTPSQQFKELVWHRPLDTFSETDIRDLMLRILSRPDGAKIVLEGLAMRLHVLKEDANHTLGPDLKRVGLQTCAALLRHDANYNDVTDYYLSEVLSSCLDEAEFPQEIGEVFDAYLERLRASYGYVGGLKNTVAVLAEKTPFRFLDGVFFAPALEDAHRHGVFREQRDERNSLSGVCVKVLLDWCRRGNFQERLVMISAAVYPFAKEPDGDGIVLSEQAHAILEGTQAPSTVLRNLSSFVQPSSWSGSLADLIEKRCQAFETLRRHDRSNIRVAATTRIAEIKRWEAQERQREQAMDRQREQRFE